MKRRKRHTKGEMQDEMQDEVVGLLTAISIVTKRLATRLRLLETGNPEPAKKIKEVADEIENEKGGST